MLFCLVVNFMLRLHWRTFFARLLHKCHDAYKKVVHENSKFEFRFAIFFPCLLSFAVSSIEEFAAFKDWCNLCLMVEKWAPWELFA